VKAVIFRFAPLPAASPAMPLWQTKAGLVGIDEPEEG
jgi:hypothetical protein